MVSLKQSRCGHAGNKCQAEYTITMFKRLAVGSEVGLHSTKPFVSVHLVIWCFREGGGGCFAVVFLVFGRVEGAVLLLFSFFFFFLYCVTAVSITRLEEVQVRGTCQYLFQVRFHRILSMYVDSALSRQQCRSCMYLRTKTALG